jgi:isocitrate dehydrogenase kinase/phosphatase
MHGLREAAEEPTLSQPRHSAAIVAHAFDTLQAAFRKVTRRAAARFERRDWRGVQRDSLERLGLYRQAVDEAVLTLRSALGGRLYERPLWARLKRGYSELIAARPDRELAETFFNSVSRRLFHTVGVDPLIEFVDSDFDAEVASEDDVYETFAVPADEDGLARLIAALLRRLPLHAPFASLEWDARAAAAEVRRVLRDAPDARALDVCVLRPAHGEPPVPALFFRNQGAYLVGRLRDADGVRPLLLALAHGPGGVTVDAALVEEELASIVFSFTRAYFHVDAPHPHALVEFLRSILPAKPVGELYTSLGFDKHGKTELYRRLLRHLRASDDRFDVAPGERGMVMTVFTMPGFDVVFKIIRDRFAEPKTTTRRHVMDNYQLVFRHDRAGRLVDAQEFEHLEFERRRFSERLLDELRRVAAGSVFERGERVEIRHVYTERRLVPLDVYLREADAAAARDAVVDYGRALRDLAATNIFPGDLLIKNFGVTRHRRVVFYDYDELTPLTRCRFLELPRGRGGFDEDDGDDWNAGEVRVAAGDDDIYPEQLFDFVGLPRALRAVFAEAHGELMTPRWWRDMQARLEAGELTEVFPYPPERRLPRPPA